MANLNYKDWTQQRADKIAEERYGVDFYELTSSTQIKVWEEAERDYVDYESARIDAAYDAAQEREAYERWKERQLELVEKGAE